MVLLSSSATAIKTIASLLAPGEQVTFLIASGSATFNTGGNIALGNLSSIVLTGPGTVSFVYSDADNSWNVVGPSPVREVTYDLANQSAGIGTTSIYTIAANATGMYRISGSLVTTTAGTGGTVSVTIGNNNGSAPSTQGPYGITQLNTQGGRLLSQSPSIVRLARTLLTRPRFQIQWEALNMLCTFASRP